MVASSNKEWWLNDVGTNMLKGVDGDTDNPLLLTDEAIIEFLMQIQPARDSFERLVPTMLPDEQTRLTGLASGVAWWAPSDQSAAVDNFQHVINTGSVRRGGGWCPPPYVNGQ